MRTLKKAGVEAPTKPQNYQNQFYHQDLTLSIANLILQAALLLSQNQQSSLQRFFQTKVKQDLKYAERQL